jgi:hypothetical protein
MSDSENEMDDCFVFAQKQSNSASRKADYDAAFALAREAMEELR